MTLIIFDYPCGKEVLDRALSAKVPDSANGSNSNNSGSSLICCEAFGRPARNCHSEEQHWHQTLLNHCNDAIFQ